jgi:predicted GNAT family acetyltransferase
VPALYDLWSAAGLSFKIHGRDRQDRLSAHFARPETGGWAIERDHKIIACCLTSSDGRKGWIERLATAPEQRRSGLAAVLVAAAKQSLLDSGNLVIGALIENDNTASRLLFEAAGFVRDNDYSYFSFRQSPES